MNKHITPFAILAAALCGCSAPSDPNAQFVFATVRQIGLIQNDFGRLIPQAGVVAEDGQLVLLSEKLAQIAYRCGIREGDKVRITLVDNYMVAISLATTNTLPLEAK